jgi:hypothetical protein
MFESIVATKQHVLNKNESQINFDRDALRMKDKNFYIGKSLDLWSSKFNNKINNKLANTNSTNIIDKDIITNATRLDKSQLDDYILEIEKSLDKLKSIREILNEKPKAIESLLAPKQTTEQAKLTRKTIFDIYDQAAKVIGRNSPEAVAADARLQVKRLATVSHIKPYSPSIHGSIEGWKSIEIKPYLDVDMLEAADTLQAFRHLDVDVLRKAHQVLAKSDSVRTRPWNKKAS